LTYQSQILFELDIVAELFVCDKSAEGGSAEIVATAEDTAGTCARRGRRKDRSYHRSRANRRARDDAGVSRGDALGCSTHVLIDVLGGSVLICDARSIERALN
jgi:hypothetical protein